MTPMFSVLHATYGRPEKAIQAMRTFSERCTNPEWVEYIFAINGNDPSAQKFTDLIDAEMSSADSPGSAFRNVDFVQGDFHGSAPAWDAAAKMSTGTILIQGQDDIEPPVDWDINLQKRFTRLPYMPAVFIAVSDGYRKDALCCTAIMNRAYYELEGCFLCPDYISVFSDDDVTYRALRNARDGKAQYIEARELVFLHRHHYHDKSVPMDDTYMRENSATAYRVGQKLFHERNPRALTDGLKTW